MDLHTSAVVQRSHSAPFVIESLTLPEPKPDEVVVRIVGAGLCHTDLIPGRESFSGHRPIVVGHEGSGVVEHVGANVQDIAPGDHVVLTFDSCGQCRQCTGGHPAYCDTFLPRNLSGRDVERSRFATGEAGDDVAVRWFGQSSLATRAIARARNTVVVDRDLPLEVLGPLGCGIQTGAGSIVSALDVAPHHAVAVIGVGAVGLAAVMAAHRVGVRSLVAVDVHPSRLALAQRFGAHHLVQAGDHQALADYAASVGGLDVVLDTSGVNEAIAAAVTALAPRGICGLVGATTSDLVLSPAALRMGKRIVTIYEGDVVPHEFIPEMIRWWRAGEFPFDELIRSYPLDDVNIAAADAAAGSTVKPVLLPT